MANAHKYIDDGTLEMIKTECFREDFCRPENVLGLNEVLKPLKDVMDRCISAKHVDYKGLYEEVILLRAKAIKKSKKGKRLPPIHTALLDTIIYL